MQFTDTSEKGFQKYIVKELTKNSGYLESDSNNFNVAISKAQTEISKIKEYQESLITNLVTGKLKVPINTAGKTELEKAEAEQ